MAEDNVQVTLPRRLVNLLPQAIDDAIWYRMSDDEDEDGKNDNAQADRYRELLAMIQTSELFGPSKIENELDIQE